MNAVAYSLDWIGVILLVGVVILAYGQARIERELAAINAHLRDSPNSRVDTAGHPRKDLRA